MTRHVFTFALVTMFAASAPAVLDAQRGGGARMGGANMGGATNGGGAGANTGGMRGGGGARGGRGAGGGARGGRGAGGGGLQIQAGVNFPAFRIPPPAGLSISRPIGSQITGVETNPPPGFGPQRRSPFDARRGTFTRLHPFNSFGYGYGAVSGPSYEPESTYEKLYRTPQVEETSGALLLDVTPPTALVFVDSALVGSVADLQARGVTLSQGRHWLDLEAPGYEKKTIEITIRPGEPLRYRFDMVPVRTAATVVPERPETMYAIPGCYGGNRPPVAANLPRGCDIAKVRVIRPQPRVN
ncbi:MAG TPA: hypothetical protein VN654_27850 [Vicinamibacterales bacterium]|jgi:hypothetical protein|nr:hypothetical protein [Vicinamibacterales bacterium]